MHSPTVVNNKLPWWKTPIDAKTATTPVTRSEVIVREKTRPDLCVTDTENARMVGQIEVLSEAEVERRRNFDRNSKPVSMAEERRYINELGFDVVMFDSTGRYWRIPQDARNITGNFYILSRTIADEGVAVKSKLPTTNGASGAGLPDLAMEISKGWIRKPYHDGRSKYCEWELSVSDYDFIEDTIHLSQLDIYITKITNHIDAPYHPAALGRLTGETYGDGINFGAFVNWRDGEKPPNYYVRICNETRKLPLTKNPNLPTGVFRFVRDGNKTITPQLVDPNKLGVTKYWHEIPIFETRHEADNATSQNIAGQMELDRKRLLEEEINKIQESHRKEIELVGEKLKDAEDRYRLQKLDTAADKKQSELRIAEVKERGAVREDFREDTSSWLKSMAGLVTMGVGLWKAFS